MLERGNRWLLMAQKHLLLLFTGCVPRSLPSGAVQPRPIEVSSITKSA